MAGLSEVIVPRYKGEGQVHFQKIVCDFRVVSALKTNVQKDGIEVAFRQFLPCHSKVVRDARNAVALRLKALLDDALA